MVLFSLLVFVYYVLAGFEIQIAVIYAKMIFLLLLLRFSVLVVVVVAAFYCCYMLCWGNMFGLLLLLFSLCVLAFIFDLLCLVSCAMF